MLYSVYSRELSTPIIHKLSCKTTTGLLKFSKYGLISSICKKECISLLINASRSCVVVAAAAEAVEENVVNQDLEPSDWTARPLCR